MTLITDRRALTFAFPDLGSDARLHVTFRRTPRTADLDDLPRLTSDTTLPLAQGSPTGDADAVLPMWQSEAMWIDFSSPHLHPFLVMIGVEGVNQNYGVQNGRVIDANRSPGVTSQTLLNAAVAAGTLRTVTNADVFQVRARVQRDF